MYFTRRQSKLLNVIANFGRILNKPIFTGPAQNSVIHCREILEGPLKISICCLRSSELNGNFPEKRESYISPVNDIKNSKKLYRCIRSPRKRKCYNKSHNSRKNKIFLSSQVIKHKKCHLMSTEKSRMHFIAIKCHLL